MGENKAFSMATRLLDMMIGKTRVLLTARRDFKRGIT